MTYPNHHRLVTFDADGATVDAFHAVEEAFLRHGLALGDRERFQKHRKPLKYLGGPREFPDNLRHPVGEQT